jgi:CDP-diacylglycerol--serine O-phosphatidyltransferase
MPSAVTAASVTAGFVSILLAADGRYDHAVYLLFLAIFLDVIDGRVARWLGATSEFGRQLDSLSDFLTSGAAPAILVYLAILRDWGAGGIVVVMIYVLAAMFRLARFNIVSDVHAKASRTLGAPAPCGAGYLMALTLMRDHVDPIGTTLMVLFAAGAMISHWRLPEIKGASPVTAMLVVGIVNYLVMMVWPNWYTVGWWNIWNLAILLAARAEDRKFELRERYSTSTTRD